MYEPKPQLAIEFKLAAACHQRFVAFIEEECARETRLRNEAITQSSLRTKVCLHSGAIKAYQNSSWEFRFAPTSETPSYSHFLNEISRLLGLRSSFKLAEVGEMTGNLMAIAPNSIEHQRALEALATPTGEANAYRKMYEHFALLVQPYLDELKSA